MTRSVGYQIGARSTYDAPDGRSATNWTDVERYDSRGCQYQQGPTPVHQRKG